MQHHYWSTNIYSTCMENCLQSSLTLWSLVYSLITLSELSVKVTREKMQDLTHSRLLSVLLLFNIINWVCFVFFSLQLIHHDESDCSPAEGDETPFTVFTQGENTPRKYKILRPQSSACSYWMLLLVETLWTKPFNRSLVLNPCDYRIPERDSDSHLCL